MKTVFVIQLMVFFATAWAWANPQRPTAPTHNCGSYSQATQYREYLQCVSNYNSQVVTYQNQVNQYNQAMHARGTTPMTSAAGIILSPNPPQNNCGSAPPVTDNSAWQTYNTCAQIYNSNKHYYNSVVDSFNNINQQLMAQQQAAQDAEARRLQEIRPENQGTTTGTLAQVQQNSNSASKIYQVAGAALLAYGTYKIVVGNGYLAACSGTNYGACVAAAAAFAAGYKLFDQSNKAGVTAGSLNQNTIQTCQLNNQVSSIQQNCNTNDPNSPIYNPGISTPPEQAWFDPTTGQCKPDAPQTCKDMMEGNNGYQPIGATLPKLSGGCPGGGNACLTAAPPLVVQTAKGPKITMKGTDGKDYTIYPEDYKDEKSLIAAGVAPAMAKQALADITGQDEKAKKILDDAKKQTDGLEKNDFGSGTSIAGIGSSNMNIESPEDFAKRNKRFKDDLLAAQAKRKPSSAGLSKDFHGDLIGSAGDDIFTMMNRRYQLKNEQDTFFIP